VTTGDAVMRDMFYDGNGKPEPGAIVCRVAPSFIRFGNFELPASRGDVELLKKLIDFTIWRDFPELVGAGPEASQGAVAELGEDVYTEWFGQVCERTARMIAHWMRVGFVHGVMNTDNLSILGLTIDYGPYGWIDNFDPDWTPNTTDAGGKRYRFGQQAQIAHWNLGQLANALAPAFGSVEPLEAGLQRYMGTYNAVALEDIAAKLGLAECRDADVELMQGLYGLLNSAEVDMTIFFRALTDIDTDKPSLAPFEAAFYDEAKRKQTESGFNDWLTHYAERIKDDALTAEQRREKMRAANPKYVLRNYLAQQAIDQAEQGDYAGINDLLDVMRRPYDDQPGREAFAERRPDWARNRAGCSMLSCSS